LIACCSSQSSEPSVHAAPSWPVVFPPNKSFPSLHPRVGAMPDPHSRARILLCMHWGCACGEERTRCPTLENKKSLVAPHKTKKSCFACLACPSTHCTEPSGNDCPQLLLPHLLGWSLLQWRQLGQPVLLRELERCEELQVDEGQCFGHVPPPARLCALLPVEKAPGWGMRLLTGTARNVCMLFSCSNKGYNPQPLTVNKNARRSASQSCPPSQLSQQRIYCTGTDCKTRLVFCRAQ